MTKKIVLSDNNPISIGFFINIHNSIIFHITMSHSCVLYAYSPSNCVKWMVRGCNTIHELNILEADLHVLMTIDSVVPRTPHKLVLTCSIKVLNI